MTESFENFYEVSLKCCQDMVWLRKCFDTVGLTSGLSSILKFSEKHQLIMWYFHNPQKINFTIYKLMKMKWITSGESPRKEIFFGKMSNDHNKFISFICLIFWCFLTNLKLDFFKKIISHLICFADNSFSQVFKRLSK